MEYLENEARSPIAQGAFLLSKTHLIKRGISAINVLTRRLRFWQLQNAEIWTKAEQARFHRAQGYHLQRQGDPAAAQAKFAQAHQLDPSLEMDNDLGL